MIRVNRIGYHYYNYAGLEINRPHGTGDYLLLFFRVPAEVMQNGEYILVPANHFFLYNKGDSQIYRKMDDIFVNDWIHFDIEPYEEYFENLGIPFQTPFTLANNKLITDMLGDIYIEFFNEGEQHEFIMDYKVNAMFHKLSDMYRLGQKQSSAVNKYYNVLSRIRREILDYQYIPDNVEEVAGRVNMSASYLHHTYKDTFNTTIGQDIIKGKINYAEQLLQLTADSITEIARQCGYDNLEHFSRQFKKVKGVSPQKYRKNLLLKSKNVDISGSRSDNSPFVTVEDQAQ